MAEEKLQHAIGDKLDIQSKYIDGRRITDDETIDLVTMVYGGLVNKKIVAIYNRCNAMPLGLQAQMPMYYLQKKGR